MTPLHRRVALVAIILVLAAACSSTAATDDGSTRSEDGSVVEGGEVGAFRLQVGDCIASADSTQDEVESVPVVPCDEPHESQIYAAFDLDGEEFPGDTVVFSEAEDGCVSAFFDALGARDDLAEWDLSLIHPTAETWEHLNDREVLCVALKPGQTLTEDALL